MIKILATIKDTTLSDVVHQLVQAEIERRGIEINKWGME